MRVPMAANDITVISAGAQQMSTVRAERPIAGAVLYFSDANLASALETIRTQSPRTVALESQFAESGAGKAFIDRLRVLAQDVEIQLLRKTGGAWTTSGLNGGRARAGGGAGPRAGA